MSGTQGDAAGLHSLAAFEAAAEARLPPPIRALVQEGAGEGGAVRANVEAWGRWKLRTRVLRDVSRCDLGVTVLGERFSGPVMVAPSGMHGLSHPEGEAATAAGAAAAGAGMVLSMTSSLPIEAVARAGDRLWLQLYWGEDRGFLREMVQRAEACGVRALCLTADMPVRPILSDAMRRALPAFAEVQPAHGLSRAGHASAEAPWDHDARLTWKDLGWLRSITDLPLVVKGVMHGDDARAAADAGAAAVIVSNHGGRVMEEGLATADVLREVAEAAAGRVEVLVDGGVRTGADVVKALALGARAVLVGRPAVWGLAVGGADGVRRVLDILAAETRSVLGMMGLDAAQAVEASHVVNAQRFRCEA